MYRPKLIFANERTDVGMEDTLYPLTPAVLVILSGNNPMARIISVSYDDTLLLTRELMLRGAGHEVTSCLRYEEVVKNCAQIPFDLAIIGHSIPKKDKLTIIAIFREQNPHAIVVALTRAGEPRLSEVDVYVTPGDPEELIRAINRVVTMDQEAADD